MTDLSLANERLGLTVTTTGGAIWRLVARTAQGELPLLREPPAGAERSASACFPLVPFGNRVAGNRFSMGGTEHRLVPNTPGDPHDLHGDGWLGTWTVAEKPPTHLVLHFSHEARGTPYAYETNRTLRRRHTQSATGFIQGGSENPVKN